VCEVPRHRTVRIKWEYSGVVEFPPAGDSNDSKAPR